MNLLLEATFFNFKYQTGIERHFFLQLELLEKGQFFEKIYVVVKHDIPPELLTYDLDLKIIKISNDNEWEKVYKEYKFEMLYATFVPPPILPPNNIPFVYVMHDPGRYLYPNMMQKGTLDKHMELFNKYIKYNRFYVVTVSESSKKDILKLFPEIKDRIFVVYNFISKKFKIINRQGKITANSLNLECEKFFLTIGRYIPTKNTLKIVQAFKKRDRMFQDFKLVIVGRRGWYKKLNNYLTKYNVNDILELNQVSDHVLCWLYKNAYGLISASVYEGFGLPLIEARFCGCPRIFCSDISVYREIGLNDTVYFDPWSYGDLRKKVFAIKYEPKCRNMSWVNRFSVISAVEQFQTLLNLICPTI